MKACVYTKICIGMFITAIIHNSENVETTKMSIN